MPARVVFDSNVLIDCVGDKGARRQLAEALIVAAGRDILGSEDMLRGPLIDGKPSIRYPFAAVRR